MADKEAGHDALPEVLAPPPTTTSIPASLDDLKKLESSILTQMQAMMADLLAPKTTPTPQVTPIEDAGISPPKATAPNPLLPFIPAKGVPIEEDKVEDSGASSSQGKEKQKEGEHVGDSHAVPPQGSYATCVPVPMPHIVSQGLPPALDSTNFENWQFLMQSHVRSSSTELWRIIKEGFKPYDPSNLTRREVVDDQLNATALHMIHLAVSPKDRAHIRMLKTAKEAWDKLDEVFLGNESIQSSKFDEAHAEADAFIMNEGESAEDMYRRLTALAVKLRDLGASHVDDSWVKRKFYTALLPYEEGRLNAIRQNSSFRKMTSNEVLSEIIAMDIAKKTADQLIARTNNSHKSNLTLKAKVL
jgi:hypothetical protein